MDCCFKMNFQMYEPCLQLLANERFIYALTSVLTLSQTGCLRCNKIHLLGTTHYVPGFDAPSRYLAYISNATCLYNTIRHAG